MRMRASQAVQAGDREDGAELPWGTKMSLAAGESEAGGSAVGALLRETRTALGQSLADVARDIRIRQTFLQAIESGRFEALPGAAYTIGFIRTYAEHLGLEAGEVVRRFKAETGTVATSPKLNFPSPMAESGVPKGAILLIGAVIALIGYGLWYLTASRPLDVAELVLPVPEHLRQILPGGAETSGTAPGTAEGKLPKVEVVIETPAPPRASPSSTPAPPAPAPAPPAQSEAAHAAAPASPEAAGHQMPAPSDAGDQAARAPVPAPPPTLPVASAPATPGAASPPPASDGASSRVTLRATRDAWVEVRDSTNRAVLLSRLLRAGETFPVPDRPGIVLQTGNAGGLEVEIDGVAVAPLGKPGTVRRGVSLDADELRKSLIAVD